MKYTNKCYYTVRALFAEYAEERRFYRFQHMCSRPWLGINFAPTVEEIKQGFLDREVEEVRAYINRQLDIERSGPYRKKWH